MGDYADMMLDGTCCQICGTVLDYGGGGGYPVTCASCRRDEAAQRRQAPRKASVPKDRPFVCNCGKKFTTQQGLTDHTRDVHPGAAD